VSDKLNGLRIIVKRGPATVYGVARVRYNEGHPNAGQYEIERADGTSFLAPFADCRVALDWNLTPLHGRFTGVEFFQPKFLAGCTVQDGHLFTRSHGVTVPSDLTMLRDLVSGIEPGQSVDWYSHGCNEFRGRLVIDSVTPTGMTMKGGKGAHPTKCTWPVTGEPDIGPQYAHEFLVEDSRIRFLRVSPKRYGTGVADSVTITFNRKG